MGFCLLNNVAVTAAALRDRGERVLVVDWDAHHGNGTQDIFYGDGAVMYVSMHEWPLYPGTGRLDATRARARGRAHRQLPASGRRDRRRLPRRDRQRGRTRSSSSFAPTWVLVSAGYDAHRADPLTGLGLSAGDYVDLTAPDHGARRPRRLVVFLEGGYDLEALRDSIAATVSTLLGEPHGPNRRRAAARATPSCASVRDLWSDHFA